VRLKCHDNNKVESNVNQHSVLKRRVMHQHIEIQLRRMTLRLYSLSGIWSVGVSTRELQQ